MNDKQLSIIEHIEELRKRLMVIVVFFVIAIIGGFFLASPIIQFLQNSDEAKRFTLNAFSVADPMFIYLKVIIFIAIVLTSPVILYQLWAFVAPGLSETERRVTLSYIPFAFLLFIAGISFSYFVLFPYLISFMTNLSVNLDIQQTIGVNEYFNFLFQITLPFGIVFQLPVVLLFFSRLGVLDPMLLVKFRKFAWFGLFVLAAFITPPDLFSHMFTTVPLIALYEISVLISRAGYRKFLKAEQKRQQEEMQAERERILEEQQKRLHTD
ncbi:twin-arginine translocase subunit TatC [Bhargavaea ullalensis]|uniref:Sec-independent protein translocase protein TatC n=1 Tax=Bhargavaea ullalensis TaxID=1265685 RepID=A0ABV2GF22_9BACL